MSSQSIVEQWYKITISILIGLSILYFVLHLFIPGVEIIKLSKQEITDINLILFGTNNTPVDTTKVRNIPTKASGDKPTTSENIQKSEKTTIISNKDNTTSNNTTGTTPKISESTGKANSAKNNPNENLSTVNNVSTNKPNTTTTFKSTAPPDSIRRATVYNYIFSVRRPVCPEEVKAIKQNFDSYNLTQLSVVLPNFPIRVRSFFWLTEGNRWGTKDASNTFQNNCQGIEGSVYLEIIFWTWFGLIASLLYNVSESLRTSELKVNEISVHIAKFFYAPLCSLVIYFSINLLVSEGDISVSEFSYGTIVLAFILGFFSGRAIELLNRIKELILPLNKGKSEEDVKTKDNATDEESESVSDEATQAEKSAAG